MHQTARLLLWALGIRLDQRGGPRPGPALVVANHVSWLDVLALAAGGSMLPVAKAEVANWWLIGVLAQRCGALFIHRDRLSELPQQVDRIATALRRGHRVQVFPEATTRCGGALNPFRRAAFQAAIDAAVVISPVAIAYRDAHGQQVSAAAFVGDTNLLTAVFNLLRRGPITAEATWLPVIPAIVGTGTASVDRALVAAAAERSIARSLHQDVVRTGRRRSGTENWVDGRGRSQAQIWTTSAPQRTRPSDRELPIRAA